MLGFTSVNDVFPTMGMSIVVLANNGSASPDAVAKDIVAKLNPDLTKKRNTATPGENPIITARIRKVWIELHEGAVDRSLLTESFSQALTPQVVHFMHSHYSNAGPPLRWMYKGKAS